MGKQFLSGEVQVAVADKKLSEPLAHSVHSNRNGNALVSAFLYLHVKYLGNIFIALTEVAQLAKVHFLSSEVLLHQLVHQLPLTDEKYFWQLWIVKTSYTSHTFKSVGFLLPAFYW